MNQKTNSTQIGIKYMEVKILKKITLYAHDLFKVKLYKINELF